MGWLRSVGSLELQFSFPKEPYKRDDILQKGLIISRSLLIVTTPYPFKSTQHITTPLAGLSHRHARGALPTQGKHNDTTHNIWIDWCWDPIFRTNWDVRDVDELSWDLSIILGPHWGKWANLVQSAHLWISPPDFQNQSIHPFKSTQHVTTCLLRVFVLRTTTDMPCMSVCCVCSIPFHIDTTHTTRHKRSTKTFNGDIACEKKKNTTQEKHKDIQWRNCM